MKGIDIAAALAYIASGGLAGVAVGFGAIWPQYEIKAIAISGIVIGLAGLLTRLVHNQTPTVPKGP